MVRFRFSSFANRLLPVPESALREIGLSQAVSVPSKILRECDVPNVKWSVGISGQECQQVGSLHTSTKASAIPEVPVGGGATNNGIVGKKPPPVLEWNPLVHTEWQLGVGGRLLPKLPEGTKVGKLVMGKYGLYKPGVHNIAQQFFINTELKGMAPENALPLFALLTKIGKILMLLPLISVLLSMPTLLAQKPVGIYAGYIPPGGN
uniref:Chlorophyll a-b binding protein, chloroplastic n=1 Tax=Elaeophora elaphi TaxID=1147741 RepID=A0A0R3RRF9_9BILA